MTGLIVLGSTGSVGRQTLEVIELFNQQVEAKEHIKILGLAAKHDSAALHEQAEKFKVKKVVAYERGGLGPILDLAKSRADLVLNAMNGFVGLLPSLSALKARNILALANKETLVSGGPLLARYIDRIIPVDSEHSGLWQILRHEPRENVKRLIVTASGGPFFGADIEKLISASLEQALKHPTWKMSEQITINSATLVNKALEVAEAHYLFRIPMDKIAVKVERTSRVHCLVEFIDGSTQIQLAYPDMRVPISVALGMGKRVDHIVEPMDLREFRTVAFNDVDDKLFPAIQLMRKCLSQGPLFGTVYNAANEVLVEKFIHNEIGFLDIVSGIDQVISKFSNTNARPTLAEVQAADQWGREQAGLIQLHLYDEMAVKNPIPAFGT